MCNNLSPLQPQSTASRGGWGLGAGGWGLGAVFNICGCSPGRRVGYLLFILSERLLHFMLQSQKSHRKSFELCVRVHPSYLFSHSAQKCVCVFMFSFFGLISYCLIPFSFLGTFTSYQGKNAHCAFSSRI